MILAFSQLAFTQSQITISTASITGVNGTYTKLTDTYLGGVDKDSGTDLFVFGSYPSAGYAVYRKNNSWKISQFSASFIIGNEILDFSNTELYFFNSTEIKPPCVEQWHKISNSTLENLDLLGACIGGIDQVTIESSNLSFICSNGNLSIAFSVGGSLNSQNLYEVQLSDENGLFNNPLTIGSSNTSPINVTYPANIINGGTYKLKIKTVNGTNIVLSNEVSVSTSLPALFTMFTGGKACVGSAVNIEVMTNFSWNVDSVFLYHINTKIQTKTNGNFTITNTTLNDAGIYKAKYLKNGCLSDFSNNYNLSISNIASENWGDDYSKAYCTEGNNYYVSLGIGWWNVKTVPGSTIQWYKDGNVIAGNNTLDLGFYPVNTANTGFYKFKISNTNCAIPYVSDSFFVGLTTKPIFRKSLPDSLNVCSGAYPNLFAETVNQNGTSYQWQKGTTYIPNQIYSNLNLPIYETDFGFYRAVIKNPSCPDSTVSNYTKIIHRTLPITPTITPNGVFSTVLDSVLVTITPNNEVSYALIKNGIEQNITNANNLFLKENGTYYIKSKNIFNCSSDLSNTLQLSFDTVSIQLQNCSISELNGRYGVISSLPFNIVPDQGTTIYSKDYFPNPMNATGYFIFRKTGKWRIIRYSSVSPMPGMPPSVSITDYFSSISASVKVICNMDWIKSSNTTSEILDFIGNCPQLQSFNNSSNISQSACGTYTIPNGTIVTSTGNYQYITRNSFRADSTINYQITIFPIPTATISGNAIIAPSQSVALKVKFTGTKPFSLIFNGNTISNITTDSIFVNVSPIITTNFVLSSIQNTQCGVGNVSGSALIQVDANNPCINIREIPLGDSPFGIITASEKITSKGTIIQPTTYRTSKSIVLEPGFVAQNGIVFKAEIGGCN